MKGAYFITRIDNKIYSTDSIFWHCFFTKTPLPGTKKNKDIKHGKKTDWEKVTHNGKIIHTLGGK